MELEDAARIDGCGSFGFFWRVLLPLSRPALATVSVLAIVTTWNAFILPLVVLNNADQWTLPLGVMNFSTTYSSDAARIARVHRRLAHPGADLLRHRRAPHRGRPHGRIGEGLMATTGTSYRDPALSIDARVTDLLARMTRAEKIAQLGSFWAFEVVADDRVRRGAAGRPRATGSARSPGWPASTNLRPIEVAETANAIQRYHVEGTRLGIPTIIHEECLHGLIASSAPCFQQSIGAAASFDPEVVSAMAVTIRRRMLADRRPARARARPRHRPRPALGPDRGDVRRGPVPGRRARLRLHRGAPGAGPRRGRRRDRQAHGRPRPGRRRHEPGAGPHRPAGDARRAAVPVRGRRPAAGIASVMPAYCDVDGVPCHASTELLAGILRGEWGFDGIVASDYIGVEMIATAHRLTADWARRRDSRWSPASMRSCPDRGLRRAARGRPRRRTGRRGAAGHDRRPRAADEVPTRAVRPPLRRGAERRDARAARGRRGSAPPAPSPAVHWCWSRTMACCRSTGATVGSP